MSAYWVTTEDNHHDYFKDFESWYNFDEQMGYGTCELVARTARTSDSLSDEEYDKEIENAIDKIIKLDVAIDKYGNVVKYKKVKET